MNSDKILFSGDTFSSSLHTSTGNSDGQLNSMVFGTNFSGATTGTIQYYDNGTDIYIYIDANGNGTFSAADDITIRLVGIGTGMNDTHIADISTSGELSIRALVLG